MRLLNQLPPEYAIRLPPVISGMKTYGETIAPIFKMLNPIKVTSISEKMSGALGMLEPVIAVNFWSGVPNKLETIAKYKKIPLDSAPIFSVSCNGYLREKAVKKWSRIQNPFELALLLIRLNDWVEQVRMAAILKLEELMRLPVSESGLTEETVLGCMGLILDPKRFGRSQEIEFRVLNQLINLNGMPTTFANYIIKSDTDDAPQYLKLGLKRGLLADVLPRMIKEGQHSEVRRIAANTLLSGKYTWKEKREVCRREINFDFDLNKIVKIALEDKSPTVQCMALDYIVESKLNPFYKESVFRSFLPNKRISITDRAIFGLKTLNVDYVEEVRAQVRRDELSLQSFELLGRHGIKSDGILIFSKLDNVPARYKIRSLGAAAKLESKLAIGELEKIAFGTKDNLVARAAASRLCKLPYTPNLTGIINLKRLGQNIEARGYIGIIGKLPTMKLALAIAELTLVGDDLEHLTLWKLLSKKRNTGAFLPSKGEIELLKERAGDSDVLKSKFFKVLGLNLSA